MFFSAIAIVIKFRRLADRLSISRIMSVRSSIMSVFAIASPENLENDFKSDEWIGDRHNVGEELANPKPAEIEEEQQL